jgi:hypothetical protein
MRRTKLDFVGLEIEFCDRERAIRQVEEFAERGTWHPLVVFGPEGCGKTSWLKQATEMLKELGYEVIYVDPMRKDFIVHTKAKDLVKKFAEAALEAAGIAEAKLASLVVVAVRWFMGKRRRRVAVLVDDAFQAIGLDKAAMYVKSLLGLTEYPPEGCEKVVAIATTSEGLSRWEIGRHRWAEITPMWNMNEKGFEELYEKIPNPKPEVEDVWRLTGGNPEILAKLYEAKWNVETVVERLVRTKKLRDLAKKWGSYLREVVEDPDALLEKEFPEDFKKELIAGNLVVYDMYPRGLEFWIDEPPPERDEELGIGRDVAWQTPLHREAVKRVITSQ